MATSEVVVGVFGREQLSAGLVAIHQAGLGPMARVLDPVRGDLDAQLRRTGYEVPVSFADADRGIALLFITAPGSSSPRPAQPGRAERAAATMTRAGARAVYQAQRAGSATVAADPIAPEAVALDARHAPPTAALEG